MNRYIKINTIHSETKVTLHKNYFLCLSYFNQMPLALQLIIFDICIFPIKACIPNVIVGTIKIPSIPYL